MTPEISTLPNGVRIVSLAMPHVESVAAGVWARVGARHEPEKLNGISHFLEHMLFKGTARRSARRISEEIEGVGGDINANTSEERTCYYASAPAKYLPKLCDVLFDIYVNPKLAAKDIELERSVIAEEIQMYRDEPGQHVHELLNSIFWPRHSLGRPITGTTQSIAGLTRDDFLNYRLSHYHAGNTVVSAAGAVDHDRLVAQAEKALSLLPKGKQAKTTKPPDPGNEPGILFEERDIGQTHVSIGFPGVGSLSPDRHAAMLLHVILGGNSSSRLFQDLRERRGWCYSVATYPQMLSDTGMINLSISLDAKNLEKCLSILFGHLRTLHDAPCKERELRRAKEYVIGSSSMALERTGSQNSRIAQSLMSFGRVVGISEWRENVMKITPENIQEAARTYMLLNRARIAVIGPLDAGAALKKAFGKEPTRVLKPGA